MLNDLVLLHQAAQADDDLPASLNSLRWQTCLRRIVLADESYCSEIESRGDIQIYRGISAYQFLLEVVCGLHSPLIGETEVMGQFRDFCASAKFPPTSWGWFLRQTTANLIMDAKRVRHRHLEGLGSQTYGSFVRQQLKDVPSVIVIGAGKLASEIVPWLVGKTEVLVLYRSRDRAQSLADAYPQVLFDQFEMEKSAIATGETALVIAAPLTAREIEVWLSSQTSSFVKAIDLRGEAAVDSVQVSFPLVKLRDLFDSATNDRRRLAARVEAALAEVTRAATRQEEQAQFRPFGWEDLCA